MTMKPPLTPTYAAPPRTGATVLFSDKTLDHHCLSVSDLAGGAGIQSNQFLIIHRKHAAVIDPGGDLTYTPLTIELAKWCDLKNLDYVLASHQDPDIIASLPRWFMHTNAKAVCSRLWARFLPHLASPFMMKNMNVNMNERIVELPDRGGDIMLGDCAIKAVPAHFLHSVGNFHFYDPVSKILFSGDMGASIVHERENEPVQDFDAHIGAMKGFHQRYMASKKAAALWADMVRGMDVDMMVPQHGRPFQGRAMVHRFLDWISELPCGVDLLDAGNYQVP
jgi:flavorubredoxin